MGEKHDSDMTISDHYMLRCFLRGHTSEVKSIAFSPDGKFIATVSRDMNCKFWKLEDDNSFNNYLTFVCGEKYAMVVKYFKFHDICTVLIGGMDKILRIYSTTDGSMMREFVGHTDCITAIEILDGNILTGSWDNTLKLWDPTGAELKTLTYHSGAVWCLCIVGSKFLSGSADASIVLWTNFFPSKTFFGHEGPVRDLSVIRGRDEFLSCSNDCSIRLWNLNSAECISVLKGHTNFIYTFSMFPDDSYSFVSAGEEKAEFDSLVNESFNTKSLLDKIDIGTLHSESEGTAQPGSFNGQTKMLRRDNQIVIYEWSVQEKQWNFIGNALREIDETEKMSTKIRYEGIEYDHVIDVELEQGRRLKLPYNNGQDPYEAATRFLEKNSLDMFYHNQVLDFLVKSIPSASSARKLLKPDSPPNLPQSLQFPSKQLIFFKVTNVNGMFGRIQSCCPNFELNYLDKLHTYVDASLIEPIPAFYENDFPWKLLDECLSVGSEALLPSLDIVKQLVLFEQFFVTFFIDRKNCFNFDLIEFLRNFTSENVNTKCQMVALRTISNCLVHKQYYSIFIDILPQLCIMLPSPHFWLEQNIQSALCALVFNFSVLLHLELDESKFAGSFFDSLIWIFEAFGDNIKKENLTRFLSTIANMIFLPNAPLFATSASLETLSKLLGTKIPSKQLEDAKSD
ncbi:hypothetical protein MXB_2114, partial [Myxobolus squamalis]